jgi:hypothetical protein
MPTTPVNDPTGNPFPPKPKPVPAKKPVPPQLTDEQLDKALESLKRGTL